MPTQKCYPLRLRITFKKKWQKYVGIGLIKKSILKFFLKTIKIVSFSFAYERERGREIYDFFTLFNGIWGLCILQNLLLW